MRVTELWLVYILVIVGIYILLSVTGISNNIDRTARLFFSLLVGAIVVFIFLPSINLTTPDDRTWYSLLLLIVFLLPLFIAAWIVWQRGNVSNMLGCAKDTNCTVLENKVECRGDVCAVVGAKKKCNGQLYDVHYK